MTFEFAGEERTTTVDEAYDLIRRIRIAVDSLKVKCDTCRCRILPGADCACCSTDAIEDPSF